MVVPSSAVTSTVMLFTPTASVMLPDAAPLATVTLFTLMVAPACVFVGVTVSDVVALGTDAVYAVVVVTNDGVSVPALITRLERVGLAAPDLVTAMV